MNLCTKNSQRRAVLLLAMLGVAGLGKASGPTLFDEKLDARKQLQRAVVQAGREHKNIVLDFGADWCIDCHVLEAQMEKPALASLIRKNYVVINIDVGRMDKNVDLAEKYGVPLRKGIPVLAVLDSRGKLLYAQDQGQFEAASRLTFESIQAFFEKWKPQR